MCSTEWKVDTDFFLHNKRHNHVKKQARKDKEIKPWACASERSWSGSLTVEHHILYRLMGGYCLKAQPVSFRLGMRSLCSQSHFRRYSSSPPTVAQVLCYGGTDCTASCQNYCRNQAITP